MSETIYQIEVRPRIPQALSGLLELSDNLLYSWDRNARSLFYRLDPELWEQCDHNPKLFLRRVSQDLLDQAVEDNIFMEEYSRVLSSFNSYLDKNTHHEIDEYLDIHNDLIAYFCAEFGLHESFPIYSGGLGILAGDHCKAISDLGVPFVAVGLLYRQGYFNQQIDAHGNQIATYNTAHFSELPISPVRDSNGEKLIIMVEIAGREVQLRAWHAKAGHTQMYFLDSNVEGNSDQDREITFRLYGGDKKTRIEQEIVLGIGGVRLIRELGLKPTTWHINEGHAAFSIIERCREVTNENFDFRSALEQVAAGTVFTTHTPVPAGHDIFPQQLMVEYFHNCCKRLDLEWEDFMAYGESPTAPGSFNMTAFALRGSRFHNGVSRIHGGVAAEMESYVWPQIPVEENAITYVTNGVHAPTFLARDWLNLFDMRFREWRNKLLDVDYWKCIDEIPDHRFWSLRQELKSQMLVATRRRTIQRCHRNHSNDTLSRRMTRQMIEPETDILVLGFARRFATYKRATLLFRDPERLARLLNIPDRPVLLIFAGKAHPKDGPGQDLIRNIHEFSQRQEFLGKVVILEGYNMAMARSLVAGVDVWVNNPEYPLEASGTSGQKAAMNGVVNLSVLDGWWGEGFNGHNGWGIIPHSPDTPPQIRDDEEAGDMLDILEHEIIPTFYNRGIQGYSKDWVRLSKESMKSCIPRFNASRMVMDYVKNLYTPATRQYKRMKQNDSAPAIELARWKAKIHQQWQNISIQRADDCNMSIMHGETLPIRIKAYLNGLSADDVRVECVIDSCRHNSDATIFKKPKSLVLQYQGQEDDSHIFSLDLEPVNSGVNFYKIRIYPYHELLTHPLEVGYLVWL